MSRAPYISRDNVSNESLRRSFAPAAFDRPGGVRLSPRRSSAPGNGRPLPVTVVHSRRHSSAPAAFLRPGGVPPPRRRSSAAGGRRPLPAAVDRPGCIHPPQRRSNAPATFVRLGDVCPPRRRSTASAAFVRPVAFVRSGGVRPPRRRLTAQAVFVHPGGGRPSPATNAAVADGRRRDSHDRDLYRPTETNTE